MRTAIQYALRCVIVIGVAGCGGDAEDTAPAPATAADTVVAAPVDSGFRAEPERASLPTHRIYYTLTSHEWYAQGRPLMHGGRAHQPGGMPVAASAEEMTKAGEFEGVEYYTWRGGDGATVYVPVYEGYWQAFRGDSVPVEG
ncbi:MAG TPA: hypothetical protein VK928_02210 [Longimicrobiales bacterium]|nr:hypothetical protein [Longimicrobiales bacterium]